MQRKKTITFASTTEWVELPVDVPANFVITHIRAEAISPGTQIAVSIREKSQTTAITEIPLEYYLADSPLFSAENALVEASRPSANSPRGTIYIAVKTDTVCAATVQIEYESNG